MLQATTQAVATGNSRAYWTAWVATVVFFAGFYTLLVPLPRYLEAVGLPDWQIGLILGPAVRRGPDPRVALPVAVQEVLHCASPRWAACGISGRHGIA